MFPYVCRLILAENDPSLNMAKAFAPKEHSLGNEKGTNQAPGAN
jgi:hypothetical protein